CVKLGTGTAELRLKVVDQNTYKPLSVVTVSIKKKGFEVTEESPVTNTEGMIVSKKQYTNIAFVRLFTGQLLRAKIPIEVIEGRLAVCPLLLSAQAEVEAELDLQRGRLES